MRLTEAGLSLDPDEFLGRVHDNLRSGRRLAASNQGARHDQPATTRRTRTGSVPPRAFLRRGAVTAAGLAVAGRTALSATAAPLGPARLEEITIAELGAMMASGELSAERLTRQYLDRIDALDRRGPSLRSIIEVNPDALRIARARDAERRSGRVRGPLHGIPIVLKDNIDTRDRMLTTAGSLALVDSRPLRDATVAGKLRFAGAVLLAKANLSEWANFRGFESSSGWSARGGQTRNPYILDRNPCGSSSGSATAVSANLCAPPTPTASARSRRCWPTRGCAASSSPTCCRRR